jgi:protein-tyrosine-phosphatase
MLEEADAVFVFDEENYEAVTSHHPGAAERTHLLGALCHEGPLHIADPFGGPASLYEAVYRQIAGAIAAAGQARK